MTDVYNKFKKTFKYYADYYRFLELNDEKVYNHIINAVNKKTENPSINDLVNMTMKVYYHQAKIRFEQNNKYLLALFKQHFKANDMDKSLESINLIIVKAKYDLSFEVCLLILDKYPSIKKYIEQKNVKSNYLLSKLKDLEEIVEVEKEIKDEDIKYDENFYSTDSVKAYLQETRSYPILSWEEQRALAYKVVEGDKQAREELVKSNLRLVISFAKKYLDRGLDFLDLIGAGNEGLLKAVDYYNPALGYKFTTYAGWWIKQGISRSIFNEGRTVRVPVHYAEKINKFSRELKKIEMDLGREPTFKEILLYTDYSEEEVRSFLVHSGTIASLNARVGEEDDGNELQEFIPDELNLENQVLDKEYLDGAIKIMQKILDDRLLMILVLRWGLDGEKAYTLEEVGTLMRVTRERIRQLQKKATNKLGNNGVLKSYVYDRKIPKLAVAAKEGLPSFLGVSREKAKEIVSSLSLKEQELLKKRYGDDLVTIVNYDMSLEELSYIYRGIYPKVKKMISESRLGILEEAFGDYVKEVEEKCLTLEEQDIVKTGVLVPIAIEDKIINGIINNLGDRNINSFFDNYDKRMVDLLVKVLFSNSMRLFNSFFVIKNTKKELYIDRVADKLAKMRNLLDKGITIYDLLPNVRRIIIDKIIVALNDKDREVLQEAFGNFYKDNLNLVNEEILIMVLDKIEVFAEDIKHDVNISYLFPEYSNQMIKDKALKVLSKKEYEILVYYFGKNLDEGIEKYLYDKELKKVLNHIYKALNNKTLTLNDYLGIDNWDRDKYLSASDRVILEKALGKNYIDKPVNNFLYPSEKAKFMTLIKKLRNEMGLMSIINLLDLNEEYYDTIYEVLLSLNDEDSKLLVEYLGDNPFNITKDNVEILENSLIDKLLKRIKEEVIKLQPIVQKNGEYAFYRYINIKKDLSKDVLKGVKKLKKKEIEVISSVFGYNFLEKSVLSDYSDEKRKNLNIVKEKLLNDLKKINSYRIRKSYGFYDYFRVNREDRFYIEKVLDNLADYQLRVIKKKYGDNFLDDDKYKEALNQVENNIMSGLKKTLGERVEFLREQEQNHKNYFFDDYLEIDKDKYLDLIKRNIENLNEEDKKLLIACFGKHYLDYPLNLINKKYKYRMINLKKQILKGITEEVNILYKYFGISLDDKNYFEEVVKNLTPVQRKCLEEKFGSDFLNNPVRNKISKAASARMSSIKKIILRDIASLKLGKQIKKRKNITNENVFFAYLGLDYSKDKYAVEEAIKVLSEDQKEILVLRFGNDYINNPVIQEFEDKSLGRKLGKIKIRIKACINFEPKEFYECLGLTKEDKPYIVKAVKELTERRVNLLKKKYGDDFLNKVGVARTLSQEDSVNLAKTKKILLNKIERIKNEEVIKKKKKTSNVNEFFKYLELDYGKDKKLVEEACKVLSKEQKEAIILRFGKNYLDNPVIQELENDNIKKMLRSAKHSIRIYINFEPKEFYEYFDLTREDKPYLEKAVSYLTPKQLIVIKKKYGDDFLNRVEAPKYMTNKEISLLFYARSVLIKNVAILKEKDNKYSIYDYLEVNEDKVYVPEAIISLSKEDIDMIKELWGEDYLTNLVKKSITENKDMSRIKKKILNNIEFIKNRDLDKDLIKVINVSYATSLNLKNNITFTNWFNYLKKYLVVSDALILCLYLGFYNRQFTIQELAILFGSSEEVMLYKLKEIISKLKQYKDENIQKLLLSSYNN